MFSHATVFVSSCSALALHADIVWWDKNGCDKEKQNGETAKGEKLLSLPISHLKFKISSLLTPKQCLIPRLQLQAMTTLKWGQRWVAVV